MSSKILFTGFDPFGGESINPAWEAVSRIESDVVKLKIPTVYYKSIDIVVEKISELKPDAVVLVGQAGGRACVTLERVAVNEMNSSAGDNEGNVLTGKIYPDGCDSLFSTLPNERLIAAIAAGGIPARMSESAGRFVCNHLLYGVLRHIAINNLPTVCGFVHVPFIPQQVVSRPDTPSMSLDTTVSALNIIAQNLK